MSAFLGPIHIWLYNKVLWHEAVGGDVDLYNMLRNQWLDAFISDDFELITSEDGIYEIRRIG